MTRHDLLPSLLLAVACGPSEPADDDTDARPDPQPAPARVDPDLDGPYDAGVTTLVVERPSLPPLTVEVWYPAAPADGALPDGYGEGVLRFPGGAFRDAPPDPRGGPYPVVAFSHGFGGIRFQSTFLTEHLARHGFVVVAPDHAGSTLLDLGAVPMGTAAARRPADVTHAVDALARVPDLDVDADAYAVVGHSFGGWTALAVAGGVVDAEGFAGLCATEPRTACRFFDDEPFDAEEVAAWLHPDPRATVAVAISPGAWYAFGPDGAGLGDVRHALVLGGTEDGDMPFEAEIRGTYDALGDPKALGAIRDTGHWAVTELCALLPVEDCAGEAGGYLEPTRVQELVRSRVLAWARVHLLGDDRDRPWLAPEGDELTWVEVE